MPSAECRRSWLYSSIQATTSRRAWARVASLASRRSSNFRVECQDSMTALSSAEPTRPIDWRTPSRAQAVRRDPAVYSAALVGVEDDPGDLFGAAAGGHRHRDRLTGQLRVRMQPGGRAE